MTNVAESVVMRLDECRVEELTWLWPRHIAAGKLTLLDGDPEQGKSLLTLDLAARLSSGRPFPDGHALTEAAAVLLIGSEDGLKDTVLPRLHAAGADMTRVLLWEGRKHNGTCLPPVFPQDCAPLQQIIEAHKVRLVFIDPFLAYLSARACSVNDQQVRQALTPLARVAEATRTAIVLIRHLTKGGQGGNALYRGTGAIAIMGAARTAFLLGTDPVDRRRVLACTKTNLTVRPPALGFWVRTGPGGQPQLEWTGEVERNADDLLLRRRSSRGDGKPAAADHLQAWLAAGPQSRDRLNCKARGHGFGERSLHRAKAWLKVVSRKTYHEGRGIWYWQLPGIRGRSNRPTTTPSSWASSGPWTTTRRTVALCSRTKNEPRKARLTVRQPDARLSSFPCSLMLPRCSLVPKLRLGTHGREALLRVLCKTLLPRSDASASPDYPRGTRSRASPPCVPKRSLGTRESAGGSGTLPLQ